MDCPVCKTKLKVIDSRMISKNKRIRKYRCPECGFYECTEEDFPGQKKE